MYDISATMIAGRLENTNTSCATTERGCSSVQLWSVQYMQTRHQGWIRMTIIMVTKMIIMTSLKWKYNLRNTRESLFNCDQCSWLCNMCKPGIQLFWSDENEKREGNFRNGHGIADIENGKLTSHGWECSREDVAIPFFAKDLIALVYAGNILESRQLDL